VKQNRKTTWHIAILIGVLVLVSTVPLEHPAEASNTSIQGYVDALKSAFRELTDRDLQGTVEVTPGSGFEIDPNAKVVKVGADEFTKSYHGIIGGRGFYLVAYGLVNLSIPNLPGNGADPLWHFNLTLKKGEFKTELATEVVTYWLLEKVGSYNGVNLKKIAEYRKSEVISEYKKIGKAKQVEWLFKYLNDKTIKDVITGVYWGDYPDVYGWTCKSSLLYRRIKKTYPYVKPPVPLSSPKKIEHDSCLINVLPIYHLGIKLGNEKLSYTVILFNHTSREYIIGINKTSSGYTVGLWIKYLNMTTLEVKPLWFDSSEKLTLTFVDGYNLTISSADVGKTFTTPLAGGFWELEYLDLYLHSYWWGIHEVHKPKLKWYDHKGYVIIEEYLSSLAGDSLRASLNVSAWSDEMLKIEMLYLVDSSYKQEIDYGNATVNLTLEDIGKTFILDRETGLVVGLQGEALPGWSFVGNTRIDPRKGVIILTPDEWGRRGAAWFDKPVDLSRPFTATIIFYAGHKGGADGIAVGFQARGLDALGGSGGDCGFKGITPAVGFKLWEYKEKVTFVDDGNEEDVTGGVSFADGKEHVLKLSWNPTTKSLTLEVDGHVYASRTIDLNAKFGSAKVYFGVTAATGGRTNLHYFVPADEFMLAAVPEKAKTMLSTLSGLGRDTIELAPIVSDMETALKEENYRKVLQDYYTFRTQLVRRTLPEIKENLKDTLIVQQMNISSIALDALVQAIKKAAFEGDVVSALNYSESARNLALNMSEQKIAEMIREINKLKEQLREHGVSVSSMDEKISSIEELRKEGRYVEACRVAASLETKLREVLNMTLMVEERITGLQSLYKASKIGEISEDEFNAGIARAKELMREWKFSEAMRVLSDLEKKIMPWQLVGDAYFDNSTGVIVLTPDQGSKRGAAWFKYQVNLSKPFKAILMFYAGRQSGGDGIAVGFQSLGPKAIGGYGSDCGFRGISRAVGFKLWELNRKIYLVTPGGERKLADVSFADGKEHKMTIYWDPKTKTLTLEVDGRNYTQVNVDIPALLGSETAYFGVSAGNGAAHNLHYFVPLALYVPGEMKAKLKITGTPEGAEVYINGTLKGKIPVELTLKPGKYSITIRKEGYNEKSLTITLKPGERRELRVALEKAHTSTTSVVRTTTSSTTHREHSTTSTTTTTSKTGETSSTTENTGTSSSSKSGGGICGPAGLVLLVLLPVLARRRR